MQHCHILQVDAARRANVVWHRIQLRQCWNRWKRSDAAESKAAALAEAEAAAGALMLAFMDKLAGRHRRKRLQILVFTTWKQRVECNKRIRRRLREVLGKRQDVTIGQHFRSWRRAAEWQRQRRERLLRVVNQQQAREMRLALERWKRWSLEVWHSRQLEQAMWAMAQQRQENAKRIATVKFLSWQRPCLEASFLRWKVHGEQRRQELVERTMAQKRRLLKNVWLSWSTQVHDNKRRSDLDRLLLGEKLIALTTDAFLRWKRRQNEMQLVHDSLLRLARIHELWQWRRGLQALRQHQQDAFRRQSVLAATAFSTHNARQREKQTQLMRNAALVLQRKHDVALRERYFQRWRLGVKTDKAVDSLIRRTRSRSQKRAIRRHLIEWRWCIRQKVILRQRISKRQETWGCRRQQRVWRTWMQFVEHSLHVKRLIFDRLVLCALQHSLQGAWGRWRAHTKHVHGLMEARRVAQWEHATAERDSQFSSLEDKHERLLLKAARLQQHNQILRQRQAAAAAKTLLHVLECSAFGHKPRISAAFDRWKHKLVQLRVLQTRLNAIAAHQQRSALLRWRNATAQTRSAADAKRVQLDAMEWTARAVHSCATQVFKRRILAVWKAFARAQRGTKQRLLVAKRSRQQRLLQHCWARWRRTLDTREEQEGAIRSLQQRKEHKVVQQAYWRWRRWHDRSRACRLRAAQRLATLWHACQQHDKLRGWNRWRNFTIQATVTQIQTKLLLVELEQWEAAGRHELAQRLLLTFSNWKLYARGERARRDGLSGAHSVIQRRRLLSRCITSWRRRVDSKRKQMLLARLLQRILRRHCTVILKRALWLWFARVQTASSALARVARQLQLPSTQHASTTDVPAQIARVAVQELLHLRRQFSRSQQRSAWRLVDVTVRNARRQQLQSAFARLAKGGNTRSKRSFFLPKQTASGRAVVDKLALLLLRRGFQHWKQQYVALAIQEAEAAQQELLHALRHVTSYRQALDPYAPTRSGG
ncbi:hypothetical protein BBJ28_00013035 [Nothophytophthora sp. Chile5]|nr:hypothetical protein BBJ28_00013035 [Nothophytophthora sp. Chile5]